MKVWSLVIPCLLAAASAHAAAPRPSDLVLAELRASTDGIKPGQPFDVGVFLKVKAGWHIYWKYPGDSGMATRVELELPDGWKAESWQFPLPKKFVQPGDVVGYGYEDEVMLIARVTPPANIDAKAVDLTATVRWLCCADVCVPGKAQVAKTLPLKDDANADYDQTFKPWRERMPQQGKPLVTTGLSRGSVPTYFALAKFERAFQAYEWFPNPPKGSGVINSQIASKDVESTFSFELVPQPKGGEPMEFLVAYSDSDGKRRAVEFTLNIPPEPQAK